MSTIRDVVQAIGRREGVDTVVVLGGDGLPIDFYTEDTLDPDGVAALVPSLVSACTKLGEVAARGQFTACVSEFHGGFAIVAEVSADALVVVFTRSGTNVGPLMYELRRFRSAIAELL